MNENVAPGEIAEYALKCFCKRYPEHEDEVKNILRLHHNWYLYSFVKIVESLQNLKIAEVEKALDNAFREE